MAVKSRRNYGSKDPEEGSSQNKQFIEKSAREMKPCNS